MKMATVTVRGSKVVKIGSKAVLPNLPRRRRPKPVRDCACGCGMATRSRFAPGHDSRLRGILLRVSRGIMKIGDPTLSSGEWAAVRAEIDRLREAGQWK